MTASDDQYFHDNYLSIITWKAFLNKIKIAMALIQLYQKHLKLNLRAFLEGEPYRHTIIDGSSWKVLLVKGLKSNNDTMAGSSRVGLQNLIVEQVGTNFNVNSYEK